MKNKTYKNLEKVVVGVGLGKASAQPGFEEKVLPAIKEDLSLITGQKPRVCAAKKSIAGFKLREGTIVGLKVTLRRDRAASFLEKIISVVLPRVRDFRGVKSSSVDEGGNLTIGLKEQTVFPEINMEMLKSSFGLEVTIIPKTRKKEEAMELYKSMGIPFSKTY